MKKILYILLLPLILFSCSKTKTAEETAKNHVQSMLKNPESFQVEYIDAVEDTIPFFLDKAVLQAAKSSYEALEKYNRYKDMSYLWQEEKAASTWQVVGSKLALDSLCKEDFRKKEPQTEIVVLMKSSGTNPMGGRVSSKEIIIVDKKDPKKVLGFFTVDNDFKNYVALAKLSRDPNWEIKENQFGKYETEGLPRIEQFIFDE